MSVLVNVLAHILQSYPPTMSEELSNARVTKMVYLSDWRNCLITGQQITGIRWYFDNHGPFVWDVKETAEAYPSLFEIDEVPNMYGAKKRKFKLKARSFSIDLPMCSKEAIDHIVAVTSKLYWADFIKLVYATHPVASSERYSYLDLVASAREYLALQKA